MKKRIICFTILFLSNVSGFSQVKAWAKDEIFTYKLADNKNKITNLIVISKDLIHYQWFDEKKPVDKNVVNDKNTQEQILNLMDKYKFSKLKSGKMNKTALSIILTHKEIDSTKEIIVNQDSKTQEKEVAFSKDVLEVILKKVFEQELKTYPK